MTGNSRPHGLPVFGLVEAGPGGAHAGADHVRADHEIALGVDRLAGADHGLPPAGLLRDRMHVGDVLVAGERVADQHRIAALGVERAVGLIGDLEGARSTPASSLSGLSGPKRTTGECGWSASRARSAGSSVASDRPRPWSPALAQTPPLLGPHLGRRIGLVKPSPDLTVNVFFDFKALLIRLDSSWFQAWPSLSMRAMAKSHGHPIQNTRRSPICGATSTASTRRCTAS